MSNTHKMRSTLPVVVVALFAAHVAAAAPDRTHPPALGPLAPFQVTAPVEWQLSNGLRVVFVERHRAPLVDAVLLLAAGDIHDAPDAPGVAHYTAEMLTEGAKDLDALAFADAVGALGASLHSGSGPHSASVSLHCTSARVDDAFALMADAVRAPRFDGEAWARVQRTLLGDFLLAADDPTELADLAARRVAWGDAQRFGLPPSGLPRVLQSTTPKALAAFHAAHYRPDTAVLVLVGDLDRAHVDTLLARTWATWTARGTAPVAPAAAPLPVESARTVVVNIAGAPQTVIRVVQPLAADVQPYSPDLDVMNTILGGSFTSRLNDNLREKHGYAYGASSRLVFVPGAGALFSVRTSVQTDATVPALQEIDTELLRSGAVSADEVTRARNLTALSVPSNFDGGAGTAGTWAGLVELGLDAARVQAYLDAVPRVDAGAVKSAAARVVQPAHAVRVLVGDIAPMRAALEKSGPVAELFAAQLLPDLDAAQKALATK